MQAWHRRDRYAAARTSEASGFVVRRFVLSNISKKLHSAGSECVFKFTTHHTPRTQGPFKIASTFTLPKSTLLFINGKSSTEGHLEKGI